MAGKGSGRRKRQVSYNEYSSNWESAFGKSKLTQHELAKIVEHIVYVGSFGANDFDRVKDKLDESHAGKYDHGVATDIINKHLG